MEICTIRRNKFTFTDFSYNSHTRGTFTKMYNDVPFPTTFLIIEGFKNLKYNNYHECHIYTYNRRKVNSFKIVRLQCFEILSSTLPEFRRNCNNDVCTYCRCNSKISTYINIMIVNFKKKKKKEQQKYFVPHTLHLSVD